MIVENPSKSVAFFVRLKLCSVVSDNCKEILPVVWQDNYITLLPGEKRDVGATYRANQLQGAKPVVQARGLNVE